MLALTLRASGGFLTAVGLLLITSAGAMHEAIALDPGGSTGDPDDHVEVEDELLDDGDTDETGIPLFPAPVGHPSHSAHQGNPPYDLLATFCAAATIVTVRDGDWSNPATWDSGRVPTPEDRVGVRHAVRQDGDHAAAIVCVTEGAVVTVEPAIPTRLAVGTLVVTGTLEIGREGAPIGPDVVAEVVIRDAALDLASDPEQWGTGLLVLGHGRLVVHGGRQPAPFVRLAQESLAGHVELVLAEPADGWRPGDWLVIPDTRQLRRGEAGPRHYVSQTEYVEIASVSGSAVTLAAPLAHDHRGARDPDGTLVRLPHAAHLSRNVVIRSENAAGVRGHILAHHRAWVDVRWAGVYMMGRTGAQPLDSTRWEHGVPAHIGTNQIGRYALHLHHVYGPRDLPADTPQFRVIGNAVVDTRKWGIALHQSSFGVVTDNVIAWSEGGGIATEDGNEYRNVIAGNFVADSLGSFESIPSRIRTGDFGHEGSCYWFHSAQSIYRDNVGAACGAWGLVVASFGHLSDRLPLFPGADLTTPAEYRVVTYHGPDSAEETLAEQTEIYGATEKGVVFFHAGSRANPRGTIDTAWIWHVHQRPLYVYGHRQAVARGVWIRGDVAALSDEGEVPDGIDLDHYTYAHRATVEHADVRGVRVGLRLPARGARVSDSAFENWVNWESQQLIFHKPIMSQSYLFDRVDFRRLPGASHQFRIHTFLDFPRLHRHVTGISQVRAALAGTHYAFRDVTFDGSSHGRLLRLYTRWQQPDQEIPLVGLTNAGAHAQYGVSIGDALATCATSVAWIEGALCPIDAAEFLHLPLVSQRSRAIASEAAYRLIYDVESPPAVVWHRSTADVMLRPGVNWITREIALPGGAARRWSGLVEYAP